MIQMFVPPQRVPSGDYFVWNTELVASSRVIAIGIVVEAGGDLADRVPINPDVCVYTAAGELAVPLRAGSEGPHRGNIFIERSETWEPVAGDYVLKIAQSDLGIDYTAGFTVGGGRL
jgi:hypothetical protein